MMSGMTYQPGDVLLIPFPFSDRLASKRRPILLLTTADEMGDIVYLPITSSTHHADGYRLIHEHFLDGQLPKESWVRTGKPYTLNASLAIGRFGTLRNDVLKQVQQATCAKLGCDA
jgi:mRNA interferase MazF